MVFGAGGQLGVELCREFERRSWTVRPYNRQALDVTDDIAVRQETVAIKPDVVINAAAYNQVDQAESEPLGAYQANGLAVRNLAVACREVEARLVHFSTDYVFDGTKGIPYTEEDRPHPLGAYGVSKLAGELYAQAYLPNALVLRTSGVFGPGGRFTPRGNFPEMMLRLAANGKPIRVVADSVASPSYAPAMAERTAELVEQNGKGLYHLGGGEAISWFEYAKLIFKQAGVSPELVPIEGAEYKTLARRPKYSALANERLQMTGIANMPDLAAAVAHYFALRETAIAHRAS